MTVNTYFGTYQDWIFSTYTLGASQLLAVATATIETWADKAGGDPLPMTVNGASVTSISVAKGDIVPSAQIDSPADDGTLYVSANGGPRTRIVPQGLRGASGAKGDTGAQGPKGDAGPQGPKGDQGLPGVNAVPADDAVATYLGTEGTATRAAANSAYADRPGSIQATVRRLADDTADVNVLVLGDSTAAQVGQFPDLLMPEVQALYPHRTLQKATFNTPVWGAFSQVGPTGSGSHLLKFWQGAVSGTVPEQPLNYWSNWVSSIQPDLVIVHYGQNYGKNAADGGQPNDATMDRVFKERMLRFLIEIRRTCPNADVLVNSQNPRYDSGARVGISSIRAQSIRDLCADLGMAYGPVVETFLAAAAPADYVQSDGIHPTTSGTTNGAQLTADALLAQFRYRAELAVGARVAAPDGGLNLLTNGELAGFDGTTLPGWTAFNATLAKDTTNYESKNGYAVKGTGSAAAQNAIYQSLNLKRVAGQVVTLAARAFVPSSQTTGNPGRVVISGDGGLGPVSSGTITNVRDNYVWAHVTARIPEGATYATAYFNFGGAVGESCSVDRVVLTVGNLPRDA